MYGYTLGHSGKQSPVLEMAPLQGLGAEKPGQVLKTGSLQGLGTGKPGLVLEMALL